MEFCINCGTQISDTAIFCPKCGCRIIKEQIVQQPQYIIQPQYLSPYTDEGSRQNLQQPATNDKQEPKPAMPNSHMILAICSALFFCLPTGIYAIIQSSKVDKYYYEGHYEAAQEASEDAYNWSIGSIGITIFLYAVFILIYMFLDAIIEI